MSAIWHRIYGRHLAGGPSITDRFYVSISFASYVPENHGNFAAFVYERKSFLLTVTHTVNSNALLFFDHFCGVRVHSVCVRFNVLLCMWNFHNGNENTLAVLGADGLHYKLHVNNRNIFLF